MIRQVPPVILMSRQAWGPLILESSTVFPFPNFLWSQNFLPSQNSLLINRAHTHGGFHTEHQRVFTVCLEDLKMRFFPPMVISFCSCFYDLRSDSRGWNTRRQWTSRDLSYGFPNDHSDHFEDAFFYFMTPAAVMKFTNSCNGVEVSQVSS